MVAAVAVAMIVAGAAASIVAAIGDMPIAERLLCLSGLVVFIPHGYLAFICCSLLFKRLCRFRGRRTKISSSVLSIISQHRYRYFYWREKLVIGIFRR